MDAEDICEPRPAVVAEGAENEVFAFLVEEEDAGEHCAREEPEEAILWVGVWEGGERKIKVGDLGMLRSSRQVEALEMRGLVLCGRDGARARTCRFGGVEKNCWLGTSRKQLENRTIRRLSNSH